jgi:glutaredoxin
VLVSATLALAAAGARGEVTHAQSELDLFSREGCPYCAAAKTFLEELQRERPSLRIRIYDVGHDADALARLQALASAQGIRAPGVPAFWVKGELIVGFAGPETTGVRIRALLDRPAAGRREDSGEDACRPEAVTPCRNLDQGPAPSPDGIRTRLFGTLSVRTLGLPLFTVTLGLLDGFNPCAMWVLLFLLSLLVTIRNRAKMALIAGTFVAVSGLVYFAFMAAWLNVFLLIGMARTTQAALGTLALMMGLLHIKEYFSFGRGPSLSIPETAKPGLYARMRRIIHAEHMGGAILAVVVLALFVNAIELLCTAGFPAVYTHILTGHHLSWWQYYGYLALYNAAYIADDSLMVTIAVMTLGRHKLQEREGRWLQVISGTAMAGLGVLLILKPEWLI